jgi:NADH-quinone oxidoreductase subunit C
MAEDSSKPSDAPPPAPSSPQAAAEQPAAPAPTPPVKAEGAPPAAPAPAAKPAAPAAKPPAAKAPAADHVPKAAAPTGPTEPPPPADKPVPAFITALEADLPGAVTQVSYWVGDWTVIVGVDRMLEVARYLRSAPGALFDLCTDLTATDWPPRAERFDVLYMLYSTRLHHRLRVKTKVAVDQPLASVTAVWPAANWLEREVWDMFGVVFDGHPDPRRLLMPEDWDGFPLRKDYPVQIRMTPRSSEALQVTQEEFRANIEKDRLSRRD